MVAGSVGTNRASTMPRKYQILNGSLNGPWPILPPPELIQIKNGRHANANTANGQPCPADPGEHPTQLSQHKEVARKAVVPDQSLTYIILQPAQAANMRAIGDRPPTRLQ